VTYFVENRLHVALTDRIPSKHGSLFHLRGPGFRMALEESGFSTLADAGYHNDKDPSCSEVLSAIDRVYEQGEYDAHASTEDQLRGLVFGGVLGDPVLYRRADLGEICDQFLERRHGVPIQVNTTGLVSPAKESVADVVSSLEESGIQTVNVLLPAANPTSYERIMGPFYDSTNIHTTMTRRDMGNCPSKRLRTFATSFSPYRKGT